MQLEDLNVVVKVAQFRSITAAANHLSISTATASAAVKRVEKTLNCELFIRSTRSLRLSQDGEKFIPQCEQALSTLSMAKQHLKSEMDDIDDNIRISISSDLGRNLVIPWLDSLMDEHPKLHVEAHISDTNVDFYRDAVDMALRYGQPHDSNLYGFKICNMPRLLCASPDYLASYGTPSTHDDLQQHQGLAYRIQDKIYNQWQLDKGNKTINITMPCKRTCNDGDLVKRWCIAGKGIALKSVLDVGQDLLSGKLVPVLADYQISPKELWLVCPTRQSITPAMRVLRDYITGQTHELLNQLVINGFVNKAQLT